MASWISKNTRNKIYARDNAVCCYCGKQCIVGDTRTHSNPSELATLDHIVSQKELASSSTDDKDFSKKRRNPANLVVSCMRCNSSKKDVSLYVWCNQNNRNYPAILIEIATRIQKEI